MIERLERTCTRCERTLETENPQLVFEEPAGTRRVYECVCGGITITVAGPDR